MSGEDALVRLLREAGPLSSPPPPSVWDAVRTELGGQESSSATASEPVDFAARAPATGRSTPRPGRPLALLLAAAAGAGLMYAVPALVDRDEDGQPQVLARGELTQVEGEVGLGSAEIVEREGAQLLVVDLDEELDSSEGYLEVWLLRPDVSGMLTLGVLDGSHGEYLLPPGTDVQAYPVVDISVERLDGDPTHSGVSLARGQVG